MVSMDILISRESNFKKDFILIQYCQRVEISLDPLAIIMNYAQNLLALIEGSKFI